jgi:hypothetical protein
MATSKETGEISVDAQGSDKLSGLESLYSDAAADLLYPFREYNEFMN